MYIYIYIFTKAMNWWIVAVRPKATAGRVAPGARARRGAQNVPNVPRRPGEGGLALRSNHAWELLGDETNLG